MSTAPARSFTRPAIAIVIAAVIVSASALSYASFESTITKTSTSTQVSTSTLTTTSTLVSTKTVTATCNQGSSITNFDGEVMPSNSTTDCVLGITLGLGANASVTAGKNETIYLSLSNNLPTTRDVNYTSLPTLPDGLNASSPAWFDDILPLQPTCGYPSMSSYEPAFVAIYNSTGAAMQLSDSPLEILNCIQTVGQNYHPFNASQTLTDSISIGGFWTSHDASEPWINATYGQPSPGNYTIVAFDPWGQLTELGFTVSGHAPASSPSEVDVVIPPGASANPSGNFEPADLRVVIGVNNTVVFVNDDKIAANVETTSWPSNGAGFSGLLNPGQNWTVRLTVPGTYDYNNEFHPIWMKGTIVVEPLPLQLRVNMNATSIRSGQAIAATISIVNPLGVNVSFSPDYQSNTSISSWNAHDFLCGGNPTWSLAGYALFQGHYTAANLTSAGTPLNLDPPLVIECPAEANPSTVTLLPDSSTAVAYFPPNQNGFPYPPVVKQQAVMNATTETYVYKSGYYGGGPDSLFGYWVGPPGGVFGGGQNATTSSPYFHYFPPGQYTLVVDDSWGQTYYAYFEVVS